MAVKKMTSAPLSAFNSLPKALEDLEQLKIRLDNVAKDASEAIKQSKEAFDAVEAVENLREKIDEFKEAISTAALEADEKVEEILASLPDDYAEALEAINNLEIRMDSQLGEGGAIDWTYPGQYINLSKDPVDVANPIGWAMFNAAVVPCKEGDRFLLNVTGGGSPRAWAYLDADGNRISVADADKGFTNVISYAPAGAEYLVLNDKSGRTCYRGLSDVGKIAYEAHDKVVALEEVVSSLRNNIEDVRKSEAYHMAGLPCNAIDWTKKGHYIDLAKEPVDPTAFIAWGIYNSAVIPCEPGDVFTLNASGGGSPRAWSFIDENGVRVAVAVADTDYLDYLIFAPVGAKYLVINDKGGGTSYAGTSVKKWMDLLTPAVSDEDAKMLSILDIVKDYLDHNEEFIYGNWHTAFDDQVGNDIDCSSFVELIVNGTTYERSRYTGGTNSRETDIGFNFHIGEEGFPADRYSFTTAEWLNERRIGYPTHHPEDLVPLDLVFFTMNPGKNDGKYLAIDHVAIYLGHYGYTSSRGENGYLFAEVFGHTDRINQYGESEPATVAPVRLYALSHTYLTQVLKYRASVPIYRFHEASRLTIGDFDGRDGIRFSLPNLTHKAFILEFDSTYEPAVDSATGGETAEGAQEIDSSGTGAGESDDKPNGPFMYIYSSVPDEDHPNRYVKRIERGKKHNRIVVPFYGKTCQFRTWTNGDCRFENFSVTW